PDYRVWNDLHKAWICRITGANVRYLQKTFPQAQWTSAALEATAEWRGAEAATAEAAATKVAAQMSGDVDLGLWEFKTKPYQHQKIAFCLARGKDAFALFMEQGTGKTFVAVNDAGYNFTRNVIDAVLYLCPNSVKSTIEE